MRMFASRTSQDGAIVDDLLRLGDRAAKKGIRLCLSMGRGTSLDGYRQVARIAKGVKHDFVRLAWEDLPGSRRARRAPLSRAPEPSPASWSRARRPRRQAARPRRGAGAWRRRIAAFKRAEMDPKMGSFVLLGACATRARPATSRWPPTSRHCAPSSRKGLEEHPHFQAEAQCRRGVAELAIGSSLGPGDGQIDRSILDEGEGEVPQEVEGRVLEVDQAGGGEADIIEDRIARVGDGRLRERGEQVVAALAPRPQRELRVPGRGRGPARAGRESARRRKRPRARRRTAPRRCSSTPRGRPC